jgi:hypothetical protein
MNIVHELTIDDVAKVLESLCYSIDKVENYRYLDQNAKASSLNPLLELQKKFRAIRDQAKKESTDGRRLD